MIPKLPRVITKSQRCALSINQHGKFNEPSCLQQWTIIEFMNIFE